MIWFLGVVGAWAGPNEDARAVIRSDAGWSDHGTVSRGGLEEILVRHQKVGDLDCLEASAVTDLPVEPMKAIVLDIRNNPDWTSSDLQSSVVLRESGGQIDYMQVLGMPRPFSPRYWVLRGQVDSGGPWTFAWERIDAAQLYPEQLAEIKAQHGDAVEISVNVGSWSFLPAEGGTLMRFRSCTNAGGSVPQWAGERAARAMLPNNIVDLVVATRKRL